MKKNSIRAIVAAIVILVVYHLIVFTMPFAKTEVFWTSYGFTLAAFFVVAASIYIAFIHNPDAKSRFYGFPIARIGVLYGAAQLTVSLIVMALGQWIPWWIPMLVYAIGLGAAVIGLISAEAVVSEIHIQDAKLKKNIALMCSLQSRVNQMAEQTNDTAIKTLAEKFRYSDPVSSTVLAEAEADLTAAIDDLQAAVEDGDKAVLVQLCCKASDLLAERNRICKLNKN